MKNKYYQSHLKLNLNADGVASGQTLRHAAGLRLLQGHRCGGWGLKGLNDILERSRSMEISIIAVKLSDFTYVSKYSYPNENEAAIDFRQQPFINNSNCHVT